MTMWLHEATRFAFEGTLTQQSTSISHRFQVLVPHREVSIIDSISFKLALWGNRTANVIAIVSAKSCKSDWHFSGSQTGIVQCTGCNVQNVRKRCKFARRSLEQSDERRNKTVFLFRKKGSEFDVLAVPPRRMILSS